MRIVVIADSRRGAVDPPELLEEADEVAALSAMRHDASVDCRVEWERGYAEEMALSAADLALFVRWGDLDMPRRKRAARRRA